VADVKFCGLMRRDDASAAAAMGAAYVGVIFAGGPRRLTADSARTVLDAARGAARGVARGASVPRRVGVFGDQPAAEIITLARAARLDVVQLHGAAPPAAVAALRAGFAGDVWRVVRVRGGDEAAVLHGAGDGVDAVVIDTLVDGAPGGTGVALDWERLAALLQQAGRPPRLVLAGGLRPANVEQAIGLVAPDVVDVSSGVESSVGIKDHVLMRAFADAAARGGR